MVPILDANNCVVAWALRTVPASAVGAENAAISGANPTTATGTVNALGNNTLVAAPGAGKRLAIRSITVQNESATTTTVIVREGATDRYRRLLPANAILDLQFGAGNEWRLAANTALVLNLSGANAHGYTVQYFVENAT